MIKNLIVALLALCCYPAICQTQTTDSIINIATPDSIFWVDDLEKFADKNNFMFINDSGADFIEGEDYYFIGQWFSGFMGGGYNWSDVHIAIKDGKRYRVWYLPEPIPVFTTISYWDTTINNHKCIVLTTQLNNIHHGYSVVMTYGDYWAESLNIIDIENNEVLFSYKVAEENNFFYQWDLEMYDGSTGDGKTLTEEEYDSIYSFNISQDLYFIDTRTLDTISKLDYRDTSWSLVYDYNFNDDKIEFYKLNINVEDREIQEAHSAALAERKTLLPDFYYQYIPENKKWVKKIPTH